MPSSAESEARKALNRLRRAAEKARRELDALEGALRHAEGSDFPEEEYRGVDEMLSRLEDFTEEEARRLQAKILHAGGLEPGRVRRG
jgi:Cdc6-like AAA superfamily ATPase